MNKQTKLWVAGLVAVGVLLFFVELWAAILAPFVIALLLAYLTDPLVEKMVAYKIPRTLAVVVIFAILSIVLLLLLFALVPLLQRQLIYLAQQIPVVLHWLQTTAVPWLEAKLHLQAQALSIEDLRASIMDSWKNVGAIISTTLRSLTRSGLVIANQVMNIVLIPVVLFYVLRDWPKLLNASKSILPRTLEPTVVSLFQQCSEVLGAFFRGQLLVMLCLGIFYAAGLSLTGLNLGLLIGIIAGIFSVVPYLGFIIAVACAVLASLFQFNDLAHLIYVLVVLIVGNVLEGMVLTPWLVGDRIGLHPVVVIFSVLAGGQMFGFTGVLLALPAAAVIMVLLQFALHHYRNSEIYADD